MESKIAELKEYLEKNKISQNFEDVLNECLEKLPEDPFGFFANAFGRYAHKPVIEKLVARQILDSRGNPTVEVDVYAKVNGQVKLIARSSAPSGASTGSNEALELRDGDKGVYGGKGVLTACKNVNEILSPQLKGKELFDQNVLDELMCKIDGTELKTKIGGNAITATSFALAEAAAILNDEPLFLHVAKNFYGKDKIPKKFALPVPMVNILNGGKHAGGKLKIQEFMIVPSRNVPFKERLRRVVAVYHTLGGLVVKKYGVSAKNLGDEGGFAPLIDTPDEALNIIEEAITTAGFKVGEDIGLALDSASSEFYDSEKKLYEITEGKFLTSEELVDYYVELVKNHPGIMSIEDGLDEKDYAGWINMTQKLGDKIMIVQDDITTSNPRLIKQGIEEKWANALLLKINQIGTMKEGYEAVRLIHGNNGSVVVSHRSGETTNSVISDLVVGIGAGYIKTGAPARGERTAKYNRLLQIEEYLEEHGML
ncbi:enolase [Anaeramoeba ignava]|uniref:phosphopyruvate hydratase n=1 Tax=Anaeramoeba ignava TaxID=1746090 RepID=A0A9Q0L684_ANAIG|nr:enolase [Anaeramoeba ignava]|eukprot:Anaeramoba_ignava/a217922_1497.p1 GENE.a217922_1497~~a217922_1497.p1  ORF type:complete len:483 (-),score=136.45 a217922_1497:98-1546(-)